MERIRKALPGAFFYACLTLSPSASGATCPVGEFDEKVIIDHVHDGDTVKLEDGRKIRLIGIDTPELARADQPEQAFAIDARDRLRSLIDEHGDTVGLVYGKERKDHFGRTLAHLFLTDGTNLQASLLDRGLATAVAHPPNTAFTDCYSTVESHARERRDGIWGHPRYARTPVHALSENRTGFQVITGRLTRISGRKHLWLTLDDTLSVKIPTELRHHFDGIDLDCLQGKLIEVRGWPHPRKNGYFMLMRHPSALGQLEGISCNRER